MDSISYSEALGIVRAAARGRLMETAEVQTLAALGRVAAAAVVSGANVPSFPNSAMDGFAVRARDADAASDGSARRLAVRGLVAAGDFAAFESASARGGGDVAVEIMTGAPLPKGFDAVVRLEDVEVERSPAGEALSIAITRPVHAGDNVRLEGSDFRVGQPVLAAGAVMGPAQIMACASVGVSRLAVRRAPRVAILTTGSELASPDQTDLAPGTIRDCTGPLLAASLRLLGIEAEPLGVIGDDVGAIRERIARAREGGVDLIISTGAVSVGKFDFIPNCLESLGAQVRFHRVSIRPGKPILFAELPTSGGGPGRGCAFFGLPGNPVATTVGLRFFVIPYLRELLGLSPEQPARARLTLACSKPLALRAFVEGRLRLAGSTLEVEPAARRASYMVSPLLGASCWAILPEGRATVDQGAEVEVYPLDHRLDGGMFR